MPPDGFQSLDAVLVQDQPHAFVADAEGVRGLDDEVHVVYAGPGHRFAPVPPQDEEVRAGLIRARLEGMDPTEYVFPCYFIGDPDERFDPRHPPKFPRSLLALSGVVDKIRFLFDGTPTPAAPHGLMVMEKI